jgi:outer membrane protein OmpA-like peptidoglycan-associated protein
MLILSTVLPTRARAQASPDDDLSQWFVGAYYRHAWVPSMLLKPFFERGADISNDGFGIVASHVSHSGMTAELGFGYLPYHFSGAFNSRGALVEQTEHVVSKLALMHLTASLLWPIQLHRTLFLDLGLGVDLGVVLGSLRRTDAYPSHGSFRSCSGPLDPGITGPDLDPDGNAMPYCAQAYDSEGKAQPSNPADVIGAHYNTKENRVPPVMLVPMLPHLALRYMPRENLAIKLEAAYGIAQFWVGVSVHVGFGRKHPAPVTAATASAPVIAQRRVVGRVLGKLMEQGTNLPIARASVKTKRVFSAIETDDAGLFVFDQLEPGPVHLEITHPNYEPGTCDTIIPESGGDAMLHCFLQPQRKQGAISGQVKDEQGRPIAGARIEITGAQTSYATSDDNGSFALLEAPEGTYRLRVDAPGYMIQLIELEVSARETATPQIILLKAAETSHVRRNGGELSLEQQIEFETNQAEILPASEGLLREIADVLLRNRDITLLEIQGHTDDRGDHDQNVALSQARADAVRAWLIQHGVEASRLRARGFGPDRPRNPNDTPEQRAKNRRVQFIVQQVTPR